MDCNEATSDSTYHAEHQGDVRVSETSDHLGGHGQDEIASNRHL